MSLRFALQSLLAVAFGAACAYWLKADALNNASSNLVSALSVINAAIFPTVVLSATVLKPANMSLELVERYRAALRTQVYFFFGVLLFSLLTIATVVVAQALNWRLPFDVPISGKERALDGVFNGLIAMFCGFVVLRLPAFLRALVSLLDVHIDSVASEVRQRSQQQREALQRELADLPSISGHHREPQPLPTQ